MTVKAAEKSSSKDVDHNLTEKDFEILYENIADPAAVINSTHGNKVIVTNIKGKDNPVIVTIEPSSTQHRIQVNDILSAYGKRGFESWFERHAKAGNIQYVDKNKLARASREAKGIQYSKLIDALTNSGKKIRFGNSVVKPDFSASETFLQTSFTGGPTRGITRKRAEPK